MTAYVLPPTQDTRKALAFVEALASLERDYGYVLLVGPAGEVAEGNAEPVFFGPGSEPAAFVVVRQSDTLGDLRLALPS